jgi:tRNA threonylcarbamoyladenosine biosynthesis protein TsaE
MTMQLCLADAGRTLRLGQLLARSVPPGAPLPAILLQGELGAGKTTLVRGLVAALPGGNDAEVSSPSFNLLNLYPTQPETAHVDLYRLNGQEPDDTVAEVLEDDGRLVVVEWAQFLPERLLPPEHLFIRWLDAPQSGRRVRLDAVGKKSYGMLERLQRDLRGSMRPEEGPKKVDT